MAKTKQKEKEDELDIFKSGLVPKHELLNAEEKADLVKSLNIRLKQLPRMKRDDAVVKLLGGKRGGVVRVMRKSLVASEYYYYRVIV